MAEWDDETRSDREPYSEPESGTGKMLFYFFGVVVLVAVALAIGYTMGKRSVPLVAAETGAPTSTVAGTGAAKPGAARSLDTDTTADAGVSTATETPKSTKSAETPKPKDADKPAPTNSATGTTKPMPEMSGAMGKGFMVQVAAVSRQDDADALASALRKKQYPVFVMPGTGTDKLLHVQVGPFAELKDAEAMKAKLAADGYNAIVKK
jgi:cell division septation protein DedD